MKQNRNGVPIIHRNIQRQYLTKLNTRPITICAPPQTVINITCALFLKLVALISDTYTIEIVSKPPSPNPATHSATIQTQKFGASPQTINAIAVIKVDIKIPGRLPFWSAITGNT